MRSGILASKCNHYFYLIMAITARTIQLKLARLWTDPINNFNCVNVRGGVSASIGFVFRTNEVISVDVILWPSHSHSR